MSSRGLLDLPNECLLMIFERLDMPMQCNFAFTCVRFQELYQMVHKEHFKHFTLCQRRDMWQQRQIRLFFQLNGHKMRMLSIVDTSNKNSELDLTVPIYVAPICTYLQNLRSLILCVDYRLSETLIEICRHLKQLVDLTIDSSCPANYEYLALLPNLKCLDLEKMNGACGDNLFERLAELRPEVLENLRIGSKLNVDQSRYIARLRRLQMLNISNPCMEIMEHFWPMDSLRVLSITTAFQLDDIDFMRMLCEIKGLSALYVSDCPELTRHFPLFAIEFLITEELFGGSGQRRLPFCLECYRTGITEEIYEVR
ncbi:hypothetical protein KR009_002120, partial [Drosophila setifemur]